LGSSRAFLDGVAATATAALAVGFCRRYFRWNQCGLSVASRVISLRLCAVRVFRGGAATVAVAHAVASASAVAVAVAVAVEDFALLCFGFVFAVAVAGRSK
jgi:hypothetical protein